MPKHKHPVKPQSSAHSVIHGDEVYFQHDEHGPLCGRVVAVGKDGCQVAHELAGEAKYLPITWEQIHGHKARAERQFVVVDQGEDGAIVEDDAGRRAYLHGAIPAADADADADDELDEDVNPPLRKAWGESVEDRLTRLERLVATLTATHMHE